MVIQNNIMGLSAHRQSTLNTSAMSSSLEKLASGYRIGRSADDAAGLAISERMRAQITGLDRAIMNTQDGSSLIRTAEGALTEIHGMLNRMTELATQASNGILSAGDRKNIQSEMNALMGEIDRISGATNFNGANLLDGSLASGASAGVSVRGVKTEATAAVAGEYTLAAPTNGIENVTAGTTIAFTLANENHSETFEFTVSDDLSYMQTADGLRVDLTAVPPGNTTNTITARQMTDAVVRAAGETALAGEYAIADNGDGSFSMKNQVAGTAGANLASLSVAVNNAPQQSLDFGITQDAVPTDAATTIGKDSLKLFTGNNADSSVFTVNGQKFALLEAGADYTSNLSRLDSDVTAIEVSGAALSAADLSNVAATINQRTGTAFTSSADGIAVKGAAGGGLAMQVGDTAAAYNQIMVNIGNMSSNGLGLFGLSVGSQEEASRALEKISSAIDKVSSTRSDLGALQNRLSHTVNSLSVTSENMLAAESRIRDTDMAKEIMNFVKRDVLNQASLAMMAQANQQPAQVLQLLQ